MAALTNTGRPQRVMNPKPLTPRELSLAPLMAQGLSVKDMASILGIAYTTAKIAANNLQRKFGARNRVDFMLAWNGFPR